MKPILLFRRLGLVTALAGASLFAADPPAPDARVLGRDALRAFEAKDYPEFLAKMEAAVALRPDYPRLLVNLAAAQTVNDRPEDAVATLARLAALGLHSPVDKSEDFVALRGRKDFQAVVEKLAANLQPVGEGELAFSLPEMTGIIEGIAWRAKTGEFFFGDVQARAVWVRAPDGKVRRFSEDEPALLGVFGLALDEEHNTLWAATTARPEMRGFAPELENAAGLAEFDLTTGHLRRVARLPADGKEHVIGDLTLAADGTVYATDSAAPTLWRLTPGADIPEPFIEDAEFASLQGLVPTPDGKALLVADYANGLLRIELATRTVRRLPIPPDTTLIGIDGLVAAPDGSLLAVQNGVRPVRVLRLTLDHAGEEVTQVAVLEAAHLTMADPALGCVAGDHFVFIGNAGWHRFEPPATTAATPRPVPVFHTKL